MSTKTVMHGDFIEDLLRTLRRSPTDDLAKINEAAAVAEHAERLLVQVAR